MQETPIITVKGTNGVLELFENRVDLTRKKGMFLFFGFSGTKSIFISKMSAVQYSKNQYIEFIFAGSEENHKGLIKAVTDDNTITFGRKEDEDIRKIRDYIFSKIKI